MAELMDHPIAIVELISNRYGMVAPYSIPFQFLHILDGNIRVTQH